MNALTGFLSFVALLIAFGLFLQWHDRRRDSQKDVERRLKDAGSGRGV